MMCIKKGKLYVILQSFPCQNVPKVDSPMFSSAKILRYTVTKLLYSKLLTKLLYSKVLKPT